MTTDRARLQPSPGPADVRGAGGGGSKKQRSPIEAPDSLQSIARARILDLIGEGEIEGFASDVPGVVAENALTAIFLDETPIANADGSLNFKDVQVDTRLGTQHQDHIAGFPSVENEIGVGQELTPDTPYVRSVTNLDLSAVRVRISTPALSSADSETGDISGITVRYAIDLAVDGGPYAPVLQSALTGKTTSGYERSHRVDLPDATTGWIIRLRRITPSAGSATVADATFVESFTEIIDGKFRYPNSALAGITVDAAQFGSIPTRAYRVLGRRVAVPGNYDPVARTYAGSWDGTFKTAWTNNPAWIWYDLVVNDRFGLGDRVDPAQIDKWSLYRIAQYSDQLVPDGRGGLEPRFTCHLYLQTRNDALRVLQDLASVFRTMAYWSGGEVVAVADMPADPVYVYTNGNVTDGRFTYSGSGGGTRYTVALVSYSDPDDFGRQKIEPVMDDVGIGRYGIRQTEVIAIGCQSRGQAQRMGKWILLTSRLETDTVSFGVGLDGTIAMPGQIVEIADSLRAGARIGGRVRAATASVVTVDAPGDIAPGDMLTCVMPDAVSQSREVDEVDGHDVTVATAFDAAPIPDSVWAVRSATLSPQRVRVLEVARGEGLQVNITALRHVADKFAAVDEGATVEIPPIVPQVPGKVQLPPTDLAVTHREVATDNSVYLVVTIEWTAPPGAVAYDVEWRQASTGWATAGRVYGTEMDIRNVLPGPFEFRVVAVNAAGLQSVPAYGVHYEVPPNSSRPGHVLDLEQALIDHQAEIDQAAADAAAAALQAATVAALAGTPWDDETAWEADDVVYHNGRMYRALQPSTDVEPPDAAYWADIGTITEAQGNTAQAIQQLVTDVDGNAQAITQVSNDLGDTQASVTELSEVVATGLTGNLVVDGGFEQLYAHWTNNLAPNSAIGTSMARSGVYGLRMNAGSGVQTFAHLRTFPVEPGVLLQTGYWYRGVGAGSPPNGYVRLAIRWYDDSGQQVSFGAVAGTSTTTPVGVFTKVSSVITPPAAARSGRINVQSSHTSGFSWAVDDVFVEPVSHTEQAMMARHTVALDVNGYVSGTVSENDGETAGFHIRADQFSIVPPSGSGERLHWSNGNLRIYDSSNVLRVRLGVW